jgi:hypothetical protein
MPKLEYFLVCESILTDLDRNLTSAVSILDDISCPIPGHLPQVVALCTWRLDPDDQGRDFQVGFEIIWPESQGSQKDNKKYTLNFTAKGCRQRAYFRFHDIPVEQAGDIVFNLMLNGDHIATHVITVRQSRVDES